VVGRDEAARETSWPRPPATPIANSLAEMYTMQAYLQPERLAAAGVGGFDAWAATFGRTVTALELPDHRGGLGWHDRHAHLRGGADDLTLMRTLARALACFGHPDVMEMCCPQPGAQFDVDAFVASTGTMYLLGKQPAAGAGGVAPQLTALLRSSSTSPNGWLPVDRGGGSTRRCSHCSTKRPRSARFPHCPNAWPTAGFAGSLSCTACSRRPRPGTVGGPTLSWCRLR